MSVSIVVECNGCGATKALQVSQTGRDRDIYEAVRNSGWTSLYNSQHLCPECVQIALDRKKNTA